MAEPHSLSLNSSNSRAQLLDCHFISLTLQYIGDSINYQLLTRSSPCRLTEGLTKVPLITCICPGAPRGRCSNTIEPVYQQLWLKVFLFCFVQGWIDNDWKKTWKYEIAIPSWYYCWWKKSCTTWDVWNPVNNGHFCHINWLARFLPSTVVPAFSDTFCIFLSSFCLGLVGLVWGLVSFFDGWTAARAAEEYVQVSKLLKWKVASEAHSFSTALLNQGQ